MTLGEHSTDPTTAMSTPDEDEDDLDVEEAAPEDEEPPADVTIVGADDDGEAADVDEPGVELASVEPFPALARSLAADRNPVNTYVMHLAPGSRPAMRGALRRIAAFVAPGVPVDAVPWHLMRYQHTAAIRAYLSAKYAPPTVNQHLSALRGVLHEAELLGLMTTGERVNACAVKNAKIDPNAPLAGRALSDAEVCTLIDACDVASPKGSRDAAMLALLFGGALRRSEVASALMAGVSPDASLITVKGKGGKWRNVPLPPDAALVVRGWLIHRGREKGPLIGAVTRSGEIRRVGEKIARITSSGVYKRLKFIAEKVGVLKVSTHDGRRTRITKLLREGKAIVLVQLLAGHSSVTTTAKYYRGDEKAMIDASDSVSMSGSPPT
jgi:site-specific recombinase XerD